MVICSDPQRRLGAAAGQTVMPRPREFDETSALEAAVQCFWQHGFEATSLRDLTASMGLTAPSLYNAFGDKEKLFARALDQYLDRTTRGRLRRLEESLADFDAAIELKPGVAELHENRAVVVADIEKLERVPLSNACH